LQRAPVDVIFAVGSRGVHLARATTRSLPIVAIDLESEPIAEGLVERFSRPGGNLTGMFLDQPAMAAKWLQQLAETVPNLKDIAVLQQPTQAAGQLRAVQKEAARNGLGLKLFEFEADTLEAAFKAISEARLQALIILTSPLVVPSRARIAALAVAARLPSVTMFRVYAEAGGLMAYGPDPKIIGHRLASYVVRILRGSRAGDLPIEQPSRFELALNLKTAHLLNATFPPWMLASADAIFE
jgi:putative ABC transport system substrate-binding protein